MGKITELRGDLKRLVKELEDLDNAQIYNFKRMKSYVLNEQQFKLAGTEMNPEKVEAYKLDHEENRIFLFDWDGSSKRNQGG
ncbi:hypothetical protein Pint_06624 [Pistacia integerrima]|uniref:Uncharacterized protein n=1 Tax=Pistacia integerrima TaxID=434235 RepID=A0ACC0Z5Z1_9ROSI|nr:hypothetical protein Pint_06624 [Pistacia integerrima]